MDECIPIRTVVFCLKKKKKQQDDFNIVYAVTITVTINKTRVDSQPLSIGMRISACLITHFKMRPVEMKKILRSVTEYLFGIFFGDLSFRNGSERDHV